tara:strand:+ start:684 stop:974 length:291 start_codon:yes stop_codon:yes gene_type:complete
MAKGVNDTFPRQDTVGCDQFFKLLGYFLHVICWAIVLAKAETQAVIRLCCLAGVTNLLSGLRQNSENKDCLNSLAEPSDVASLIFRLKPRLSWLRH